MKTIRTLLLLAVVWSATLRPLSSASSVVAIASIPASESAASGVMVSVPPVIQKAATSYVVFAQATSIQPQINSFLDIIRLLCLPAIVALVIFGGWCIHDSRIREAIFAFLGALILALAVPIAKMLFNL